MRVPVKLLGFGFWLLSLNFARCQECRREDIKYENTESVAKASYADGETMKVNCRTGYTGLYKLKCEKGEWKKSIERPCAKRKCPHPGDTQHGDFKLMEGTEFVFGATVVYTCKKGYEMTSRINQRTCRAQGWDNAVPECEVVKCPAIHPDRDLTASGDTEEGRYGDVIRFECVSSDKMLDGHREIHCEETGEWSDVVPKCKEITCTAPVISNGNVVDPQPKYQKNAILQYRCDPGFKAKVGIPRCAKFGWTLNPECDEITCELKSTTFGVQKINPMGKTIFRAGESVKITCSEKYLIFGTKETSRSFTCQYSGQWDNEPVCEEITCKDPHDQHVSKPYNWATKKFGEKQSYSCKLGYRETAEAATCTQDGWTPKPLCTEVTCELKSTNLGVQKISPKGKTIFKAGEYVEITCSEKYWLIFTKKNRKHFACQNNGEWDNEPVCEEIKCEDPLDQHVSRPYWGNLKLGVKKNYRCEFGYRETAEEATCTQDGWTPKLLCAEITCVLKSTAFGVQKIQPMGKTIFRAGESVKITCSEKHWLHGTEESSKLFTCKDNGEWDHKPVCEEITCEDPLDQHVSRPYWGNLKLGVKKKYRCEFGYRETAEEATCTRDGWTPKLLCAGSAKCGPPPHVKDTDKMEMKKIEYNTGERVEYKCSISYTLDPHASKYLTCEKGEWKGDIKCLKPCIVTVEEMDKRSIKLRWKKNSDMISKHNDNIEFECQSRKTASSNLRLTCNDGVMVLPECK